MCSDWTRPFPPNKHLHFSPLRRTQVCTDSDGKRYLVFVQNEEFSCALAPTTILIWLLKPFCIYGSLKRGNAAQRYLRKIFRLITRIGRVAVARTNRKIRNASIWDYGEKCKESS